MLPLVVDWQQMLAVLAVAFAAGPAIWPPIAQTNLKRMLAFSTISQMGFMLLGLLAGVAAGNGGNMANAYGSSMFYVVSYVLTTLGTFGVDSAAVPARGFESDNISDLAGLNQRSPLYAGVHGDLHVLARRRAASGGFFTPSCRCCRRCWLRRNRCTSVWLCSPC